MKILVCISAVPDTTTKISFADNNTRLNKDGVQFIINPYDELALTKALEIAEPAGGTVTVVNVGGAENEAVIRKALAIGATDAIRVNAEPVDSMFVARQIAEIAKSGQYDFILTGRESIDYNSGQVCGLIGEMLNIPSINVITRIELNGSEATFERDIDGGRETLSCNTPFVASAQKDLCEPRIPNMKGIMMARTKPLTVVEPAESAHSASYAVYELPKPKEGVKMIDPSEAGKLIEILRNEAKVI